VNQDGLKLNGTQQLVGYGDGVNILRGSIHMIKKNSEALILASKEIELAGNADKTKYMFMSQDQNTGQSHNMNIDNRCFEMVEEFKYLGIAFTNQNSLQEELKSRLK
jgi:hypothetical protein